MRNVILHSFILLLIIIGVIFQFYITSLVVGILQLLFLFIIEVADDCSVLRIFSLKKIYTEWGIFYTGAFGKNIYIFKDIWLFFLYVSEIDIRYNQIKNSDELKECILRSIKRSSYLDERIVALEEKKKRREIKKIINHWNGFTSKQLERDFKIDKLL